MMLARQLRTDKEKLLFTIGVIYASLLWLVLVVTCVGILYGGLIGLGFLVAQSLFLAHVTGNGVRIGPDQFPDLHRKLLRASEKLGLPRPPEAYVVQAGGVLNAFATKLLSRHFVILNAELLEACERARPAGADPQALSAVDFVIGHEVGHLAAGHLAWKLFLLPAHLLPLFGPAYSRACEYTCDRCGNAVTDDLELSSRALAVLAAGGLLGGRVSLDAFVEQRRDTTSFWMGVFELNATHPYLSKRVAALRNFVEPGRAPGLDRTFLSYPCAPLFSFAAGGAQASLMIVIFVIAMMAAIAIPAFTKYVERTRAQQAAAASMVGSDDTAAPAERPEGGGGGGGTEGAGH